MALGKGCLAGVGMTLGFFAISGLAYLLLGPLALPSNLRLLIAVASGPIVGTLAVLVIFLALSRRASRLATRDDESTSRHSA